jgi:hypothetical protein
MLGELAPSRNSVTHRSWLRVSVAVLCISLILLGGLLFATHTHQQEAAAHPDCVLCVVAHTAIQIGAPAPQIFVIQVVTRLDASPEAPALPSIAQDPLFSRPPPADLTRA